jgi:hypothetical protein
MLLLSFKRVMDRQQDNILLITQLNNLKTRSAFLVRNAAIDSYKHAIKIKPDYAEDYNNMGSALTLYQ